MIEENFQKQRARAEYIAEMLQDYEPGYLPEPLFFAISRLTVLTGIEVTPILKDTSDILLIQRHWDDPYWPGHWHIPGTILRSTDYSISIALQRVLRDELFLDEAVIASTLDDFAFDIVSQTRRGTQLSHVHVINIDHIPAGYGVFDPYNLPDNTIEHHRKIIDSIVQEGRWF